eukprot:TRINITY_DN94475_c0_g1_i1.p1 TRINITY_DN94475_c0_g1~~TRINITY_DN94475_c0_g1_i1.p1  ORF type:complete len:124 (-),score=35.44 TRINITY_DN94475_c0_g1_i1:85-456(-)
MSGTIASTLQTMTLASLQAEVGKVTPEQIAQVTPQQLQEALSAITEEQIQTLLQVMQPNLPASVLKLTEDQLQAAVLCPNLKQYSQLAARVLGINPADKESYAKYSVDEAKQKILLPLLGQQQ